MSEPHHRRDFVRTIALGASAGLLTARPSPADDPPKKDEARPESEAEARMDLVLARFGRHLDDDARKAVRAEVDSIVRMGEALRKVPLDNGDGPFPIFVPYRAPLA
jgi:hypothetical protein